VFRCMVEGPDPSLLNSLVKRSIKAAEGVQNTSMNSGKNGWLPV
jgi:hypothetical protein